MLFAASLRHQSRRFIAPGLAVVLGVAFIAVTLVLGSSLDRTVQTMVGGDLGSYAAVADLQGRGARMDATDLDRVRAVAGVTTVHAGQLEPVLTGPQQMGYLRTVPAVPGAARATEGRLPTAAGEVAVDEVLAAASGVRVGDSLPLNRMPAEGEPTPLAAPTVVGVVDLSKDRSFGGSRSIIATNEAITAMTGTASYRQLRITATGTPDTTRNAVRSALAESAAKPLVRTGADAARAELNQLRQAGTVLTTFLLVFAAISMFVCALVVANTFTILLARRARETALLRCVGSTRSQVVRSALAEALVLGVVFSALGAALGIGLSVGALSAARGMGEGVLTSLEPVVTASALWLPVLVGTTVMVAAALRPVLRASRVAPLAALHPEAAVTVSSRRGRVRIATGFVLVALGAALLVASALLPGGGGSGAQALLLGVPGGILSFLGVLLVSGVVVPLVSALLGRLVARVTGVPGELAVENALRNPARAASTATALLVGVTLVVMTFVGSATATTSMTRELDKKFSVDLAVSATEAPLGTETVAALRAVPGVTGVAPVAGATVSIGSAGQVPAVGIPDSARAVMRNADVLAGLRPGVVVVREAAPARGLTDGAKVTVTGPRGSRDLTVAVDRRLGFGHALTEADLAAVSDGAATRSVFLRVADDADMTSVLARASEVARDAGAAVGGSGPQRQQIANALSVVTWIIAGLLAMSILIALVGIANTLALSVHERRRESALLRALGVTRGQIRSMLAIEGVLLAVVGAVLGIGLGIAYGVVGARSLLAGMSVPVTGVAPVGTLFLVLGGAVLAGLLASALPGRRAARVAPAAALAID